MLLTGRQSLAESHPADSHGGHVVGLTQHRLATVGEGEVSHQDASNSGDFPLHAGLDSKAYGEPSSASGASNSITRNASFDRYLAVDPICTLSPDWSCDQQV